jgi:hypothetical protein
LLMKSSSRISFLVACSATGTLMGALRGARSSGSRPCSSASFYCRPV